MARNILGRRALDLMNRASEMKVEIDFCAEGGGLQREMYHFAEWLGDHFRSELQRESWEEPEVERDAAGVTLYLYSPLWAVSDGDHVAFSFCWSKLLAEPPCVQLYLPAQNVFEQRNALLKRVRPKLKKSGFTDHFDGDPDPSCPIWRYIPLEEFHGLSGFAIDAFIEANFTQAEREALDRQPAVIPVAHSGEELGPV